MRNAAVMLALGGAVAVGAWFLLDVAKTRAEAAPYPYNGPPYPPPGSVPGYSYPGGSTTAQDAAAIIAATGTAAAALTTSISGAVKSHQG